MPTTALWPISNSTKSAKGAIAQVLEYVGNEEKTKESNKMKEPEISEGEIVKGDPAMTTVGSVLSYVSNKNEGLKYVTGINCVPETATKKMVFTRKMFGEKGNRVLWHGYQSFAPGESTPDQVHKMGVELAEKLWGDRFEIVVATHLDRAHLHNHIVINATSFIDGKKFNWDKEYPRMQKMSDLIAKREGLTTVEDKENEIISNGSIYTGKYTVERIVKEDIDCCIAVAKSLDEWNSLMRQKGYIIDDSRKYLRINPYGHSRCIRVDRRFGEDYTLEGIERRILNRTANTIDDDQKVSNDPGSTFINEQNSSDDMIEGFIDEQDASSEALNDFTDDEYITAVYQMLKGIQYSEPKGIQIVYLRFIVGMGTYYKSHGRIARIHYLYREELTKLDKYIDESRFLIKNDIASEEDLEYRYREDKNLLETLTESRKHMYNKLRRARSVDREDIQAKLRDINLMIKEERKNVRICERIMKRTEEMARRKEIVAEMVDKNHELRNTIMSENLE